MGLFFAFLRKFFTVGDRLSNGSSMAFLLWRWHEKNCPKSVIALRIGSKSIDSFVFEKTNMGKGVHRIISTSFVGISGQRDKEEFLVITAQIVGQIEPKNWQD